MNLWIDDERPMPPDYTHVAVNSAKAITFLSQHRGSVDVISFDHDLGYQNTDPKDTTRPVMLWMIENDVWPQVIRVHTANPVGEEWLRGMAERYAPETTLIDPRNHNGLPLEFKNYG
jgi:hypothetical protein